MIAFVDRWCIAVVCGSWWQVTANEKSFVVTVEWLVVNGESGETIIIMGSSLLPWGTLFPQVKAITRIKQVLPF